MRQSDSAFCAVYYEESADRSLAMARRILKEPSRMKMRLKNVYQMLSGLPDREKLKGC